MIKVTDKNREQIIDTYASYVIDNMDFQSLWEFARDGIVKNLKEYTTEQLEGEIKEYYPEILEE